MGMLPVDCIFFTTMVEIAKCKNKQYIVKDFAKEMSMSMRIVRLGTVRLPGEGIRIGTVRRPPRGVPKGEFASRNFYDVWLPNLAPSDELLKEAQLSKSDAQWRSFFRKYRAEMKRPENSHIIDLLAGLSHHTDISVGCYCPDEQRCHRSVLRALLLERGADVK